MADDTSLLLNRAIPEDYRQAWTDHIAKEVQLAELRTESVVVFRVGAEWFAISTHWFHGIAELTQVHPLPQRRDSIVLGIADVRGELLICVSLAEVLGITADEPQHTGGGRFLILRLEGGPIAFPVHEVHGVHRFASSDLHEPPSTLTNANTHYTAGIILLREDRSVARLDDVLLFHTITESLS